MSATTKISVEEAIAFITSQTGLHSFWPNYDVSNGLTAWRFGDLAIKKGFEKAVWYAEFIRDRVDGISPDCTLLSTFRDFKKAEESLNSPQL